MFYRSMMALDFLDQPISIFPKPSFQDCVPNWLNVRVTNFKRTILKLSFLVASTKNDALSKQIFYEAGFDLGRHVVALLPRASPVSWDLNFTSSVANLLLFKLTSCKLFAAFSWNAAKKLAFSNSFLNKLYYRNLLSLQWLSSILFLTGFAKFSRRINHRQCWLNF